MQRLQNILIAVDLCHGDRFSDGELSEAAAAAVRQGLEIAATAQAAVTFCYVLEISEQALELIRADEKNRFATVEDFAQQELKKLEVKAEVQGIKATSVLRTGSSWDELIQQIKVGKHDLVVVGTRDRSAAARTFFGSTAQRLMRTSPCPVWIVKPHEVREIREILVATDLTDACQEALHSGVSIARWLNAKLFVLHTLEYPFEAYMQTAGISDEEFVGYRKQLRQDAEARLNAQIQKTDHRTLPFGLKADILEGSPDDVLPKYIDQNEVDLLILGSHGRTGFSRMVLGNTAERILPYVHASVLAIRSE
ncbi:MAG: universal stress protein [Planctomycetaceae bacterium]